MLKQRPISTKSTLIFIVSILLVGLAYYFLIRNVYETQLLSQARTTADYVEAFGAWVSKHGRIWAKDDASSFLGSLEVVEAESIKKGAGPLRKAVFYSKNPALAQREFSEAVAASNSHARFRMTSDNYMNPLNRPDRFEAQAIDYVKLQGVKEYAKLYDGAYRYARAVIHKETCINCHGSAETAPKEVAIKYGTLRGYGFRAGDVAGIISVKLPVKPLGTALLHMLGWVEAGLILAAFLIAYVYVRFGIVKPVQQLTDMANKLSTGQNVAIMIDDIDRNSSSEIDQLSLSLNRLRLSLLLAVRRLRKMRKSRELRGESSAA